MQDWHKLLFIDLAVILISVLLAINLSTSLAHGQEHQYLDVTKWGSEGVGIGKFFQPVDIAIDSLGNIYVIDISSVSNKIQKFSGDRTFVISWGNLGFGPGKFTSPVGIDVDTSNNNVYISDIGSPETAVQVFTGEGTFLKKRGSTGLRWSVY